MNTQKMIVAILVMAFIPGIVQAGVWPSILITWSEPKTRENGATLPRAEISGYEIHGRAPGASTFTKLETVKAVDNADYSHVIRPAERREGEYCFYLTTVDTKNLVSKPSTNICMPYEEAHFPSAPVTIRVTIQIEAEAAQ